MKTHVLKILFMKDVMVNTNF